MRVALVRALLVCLLLASGCTAMPANPSTGPGDTSNDGARQAPGSLAPANSTSVPPVSGEILVFAASSLNDVFTELGQRFEEANPGADVRFNFGASSQLVAQIEQGAQADVFASADQAQMDRARSAGRIDGEDTTFVTNRLVLIAPARNPGAVHGVGDLAKQGLRIVTSQPDVPIGMYTQAMLDRVSQSPEYPRDFADRVNANIVSHEGNVRQIVAKVQLGEADAAVVYTSDVTPHVAPELVSFDIPAEFNMVAAYPIALVQGAQNRDGAAAFIAYALAPNGQEVMARWNFATVGSVAEDANARPRSGSTRVDRSDRA